MLEINLQPFPVLSTERLELRQITDNDTKDLLFLRSNNDVMKYIDIPLLKSIDEAAQKIKVDY